MRNTMKPNTPQSAFFVHTIWRRVCICVAKLVWWLFVEKALETAVLGGLHNLGVRACQR